MFYNGTIGVLGGSRTQYVPLYIPKFGVMSSYEYSYLMYNPSY